MLIGVASVALLVVGAPSGAAAAGTGSGGAGLRIEVVSNRADLISGGDALVRVALPAHATGRDVRVSVDGPDVTGSFQPQSGGSLLGLVTGLVVGPNRAGGTEVVDPGYAGVCRRDFPHFGDARTGRAGP